MASVSISGLTRLVGAPASNDLVVLVDVSDTTQGPTGTTKNGTIADLFTSVTVTTSLTVSGTATVTGTLGVTGDFAVNTNKFNVTASSGNTLVAGTLGVSGLITGSLKSVAGDTSSVLQQPTTPTQGAFFQFINTGGTLDIGIENSAGSLFGTAGAYGTVIYRPVSTAFAISRTSTVDLSISSAGAVSVASTLDVVGNFSVATNKLTVAAATGNTVVAGTLGVTSDFAVNTNKVTIAASSGNTTIAGTLGLTSDFAINTNKFTVTASSGNTLVAGTFTANGTVQLGAAAGTNLVTIGGSGYGAGVASIRLNGLTDGAGAQTGTLTNAPASGNPTVWVPINISGTVRWFPVWG